MWLASCVQTVCACSILLENAGQEHWWCLNSPVQTWLILANVIGVSSVLGCAVDQNVLGVQGIRHQVALIMKFISCAGWLVCGAS